MAKNDPRLIVTLLAINTAAEIAWNRSENRHHCVPGVTFDAGVADAVSRGTTPSAMGPEERRGSTLRLTFDNPPKNLQKGFVFGSHPKYCDVSLRGWSRFVSRQHFRIAFNTRGDLILEDTSKIPTCVVYSGERRSGRNNFTWILFRKYEDIEVTLHCESGIGNDDDEGKSKSETTNNLIFRLEWPDRSDDCEDLYKRHLHAYLKECQGALPTLGQLGIESQQPTTVPTKTQHTPRQQPIYLRDAKIGYGGFGTVYKAVDVSTGTLYAAKEFHDGKWQKEVDILKVLSHENIVQFVGCSEDRLLVMEYLPLGNLARQASVSEEEVLQILHQGLRGLEYLHFLGLAHRDIKPENILIQYFGLAKKGSALETFCGSNAYAAPEIWDGRSYTETVDIWSLGVVIYEYMYGFPYSWNPEKRKGISWCQTLERFAANEEGVEMDLVSAYMLRVDHQERLSATKCLSEVHRLGIDVIQATGSTTPTKRTVGEVDALKSTELSTSKDNAATSVQYRKDKTTTTRRKRQRPPKTQFPLPNISDTTCNSYRDSSGDEIVLKRQRAIEHQTKATSRQSKPERQQRSVSLARHVLGATDEKPSQIIEPASPSITDRLGTQSTKVKDTEAQQMQPLETLSNNELKQTYREAPTKMEQANDNQAPTQQCLPEFIEIKELSSPVVVRTADFRVNASHIFKVLGQSRTALGNLRNNLEADCYDIYRGNVKHQGTYVDFHIALELCGKHNLHDIKQCLHCLRDTLGDELPDSMPVIAAPMQAVKSEGLHPDSYAADSGNWTSIDRSPIPKPQSMPLTVNAVSSYQLESTDFDTTAAHQSGCYEVWDSQPELSHLVEIKPNLRPSTPEAAAQYGESIGELFPHP
ncbi:MAG: hypothetical protein Q9209_004004 [Squamulea sp. 1 TL-2023]